MWLQENWSAILITLISIAITWYIAYVYKSKSELSIHVVNNRIFKRTEKWPEGLSIHFFETPVSSLTKTDYYIWNSGNTIIRGGDIAKADKLRIQKPKGVAITDEIAIGKTANNVHWFSDDNFINLEFDYLNKNEGFSLSIVHDSDEPPRVLGSIAGVKITTRQDQVKFYQISKSGKIIFIIMYAFLSLIVFLLVLGIFYQELNTKIYLVLGVTTSTSVALFLNTIKSYFYRVPPKEIRNKAIEKADG